MNHIISVHVSRAAELMQISKEAPSVLKIFILPFNCSVRDWTSFNPRVEESRRLISSGNPTPLSVQVMMIRSSFWCNRVWRC